MANRRDKQAQGGMRVDESFLAFKLGAATNVGALSEKEKRDRKRVCLRIDLPGAWLKEALARAAREQDVSLSHLGAFLIAWGLAQLAEKDDFLRAAIEENRYVYRSMNAGHGLDAEAFAEFLTDSTVGDF